MDDVPQEMEGTEPVAENVDETAEPVGENPDEMSESDPEGGDEPRKRASGWERLKRKNRQHEREIRELQARIAEMQNAPVSQQAAGFDQGQGSGVDETIQKAVGFALQQRDLEERRIREAQAQAEIGKEYQELQRHLDSMSDRHDDFDEIVRSEHVPFTATIRDTALLLPKDGPGSAGEVLYKLGKNPEELDRISKLLPHKQAAEVVKLSHALIRGNEKMNPVAARPLGTVKTNPVTNSAGVTEKTSPAAIRALMKAGKFK